MTTELQAEAFNKKMEREIEEQKPAFSSKLKGYGCSETEIENFWSYAIEDKDQHDVQDTIECLDNPEFLGEYIEQTRSTEAFGERLMAQFEEEKDEIAKL